MVEDMDGPTALAGLLFLVADILLWLYYRKNGVRDWLEHRKFLRKLKEGKSMKFDVVEP
jgi:hypothetical protein